MSSRIAVVSLALLLVACSDKAKETPRPAAESSAPQPTVAAAKIPGGALKQMPWLLGTFRGTGTQGTTQAPFYERYSLADDSTLIVESFKDSTLAGAIDSTRYEARHDSLTNPGSSRYVATDISPDSVTFGPLVGVKNGFKWKKGDEKGWTAVIIPLGSPTANERWYRMERIQ